MGTNAGSCSTTAARCSLVIASHCSWDGARGSLGSTTNGATELIDEPQRSTLAVARRGDMSLARPPNLSFDGRMHVKVSVTIGGRAVPIEKVRDMRVAAPMQKAAAEIGARLERIRCPTHDKTATNVRVRFDATGNADLSYDSCCPALGEAIGSQLG